MFIGHYGPALSAKEALTQIPLLILFVQCSRWTSSVSDLRAARRERRFCCVA
jgi:hypothetical protein